MTATAADQQAASNTPAAPLANPADSYSQADWNSAYGNVTTELDGWVETIEGTIPPALEGTLYRNGPGRLERGGQWVQHPFDGDGMILAVGFHEGRAYLRNRFVRTEGWLEEEAAGQWRYRGVFGTQKPGGILANALDLRLKNIANTSVVDWGGDLLALWEAASPTALDPATLATQGLSTMGGVLAPQEAFSAHPRLDPGHHGGARLVNFGVKAGPRSAIRLMEFNPQGQLVRQRQDRFQGFAFLHDFALTPNWAVFLKNALDFNPLPYVMGRRGAAQCLRSRPGGRGEFWLIPRDTGEPVVVPATEGFVFHHVNAWEEGTNRGWWTASTTQTSPWWTPAKISAMWPLINCPPASWSAAPSTCALAMWNGSVSVSGVVSSLPCIPSVWDAVTAMRGWRWRNGRRATRLCKPLRSWIWRQGSVVCGALHHGAL